LSQQKTDNNIIQSPCIANCCLDDKDICMGCYRHIDEITGWYSANTQTRLEILNQCQLRKQSKSKLQIT